MQKYDAQGKGSLQGRCYRLVYKSANETKYWLGLLADSGIIKEVEITPLLCEVTELANMLGSGVLKLKQKKF